MPVRGQLPRKHKAVFLDRDGTLNKAIHCETKKGLPYYRAPLNPDEVELCDGVAQGLISMKAAGYLLVVITNQGRLETGEMTKEELVLINQRIDDLLIKAGAPTIDAWYWCPHKNVEGRGRHCACGKPQPKMIQDACKDLDINHKKSFMIGDDERDMIAGRAAEVRRNYMVVSDRFKETPEADLVFPTFGDAARAVCLMDEAS